MLISLEELINGNEEVSNDISRILKEREEIANNVPQNIIDYGIALEGFKRMAQNKHPGYRVFDYYTMGNNFYYSIRNPENNHMEFDLCL